MLSLMGTMAVLCGAICIGNYYAVAERTDRAIDLLYQNGGEFPNPDGDPADPAAGFRFQVTQVSRQQGAEPAAPQKQPASPRMDTVEISEEGQAASRKMQSRSTAAEEGGKASDSRYEYKPEDLSGYTDAELKLMYYRGEITRQEYEEETGKRLEE